MGGVQVAELDELVMHRAGAPIGDHQMAAPRHDRQPGHQRWTLDASSDHDRAGLQHFTARERHAAGGAMRYAGQKCTATSRVIVDRRVVEPFLEKLRMAMAALPLGPATDVACAIGPMITAAARDRVLAALAADPAEVLAGGTLPDEAAYTHGNWFAPRIVRFEGTEHPLAQRELFGPVLGLLVADDLEHALVMANATPYGLSASLFTRDLGSAMQYLRRIEVGLVRVNGDTTGVDPHAPFGGLKGSSSGSREQGRAARDFYTEIRTIQIHA